MQVNNLANAAAKAVVDKFRYVSGNDAANDGTGASSCPNWQFQVGQDVFPKKEVTTFTQSRAELDKAWLISQTSNEGMCLTGNSSMINSLSV